jgi:hypothetical protein
MQCKPFSVVFFIVLIGLGNIVKHMNKSGWCVLPGGYGLYCIGDGEHLKTAWPSMLSRLAPQCIACSSPKDPLLTPGPSWAHHFPEHCDWTTWLHTVWPYNNWVIIVFILYFLFGALMHFLGLGAFRRTRLVDINSQRVRFKSTKWTMGTEQYSYTSKDFHRA